ncbi:MAG: hypothetical protein ABEN55_00060 [Bradymonadaceae bacterium]
MDDPIALDVGRNLLERVDYGLTLHWPWATAVTDGTKRIENRTWEPWDEVMGEFIAIHCGKTRDDDAVAQIEFDSTIDWHPDDGRGYDDVAGCIIGIARVRGRWRADDPNAAEEEPFFGPVQYAWWAGPVGWLLWDVVALTEPVPARGKPGLWPVDEQIEAALDHCDRCGRPGGRTVAELDSGAWSDGEQWYDSEGLEIDLVPRGKTVSRSEVQLEETVIGGEDRELCRPCRGHFGIGTDVDSTGQGLLV